jgi:hypothetical protein
MPNGALRLLGQAHQRDPEPQPWANEEGLYGVAVGDLADED